MAINLIDELALEEIKLRLTAIEKNQGKIIGHLEGLEAMLGTPSPDHALTEIEEPFDTPDGIGSPAHAEIDPEIKDALENVDGRDGGSMVFPRTRGDRPEDLI